MNEKYNDIYHAQVFCSKIFINQRSEAPFNFVVLCRARVAQTRPSTDTVFWNRCCCRDNGVFVYNFMSWRNCKCYLPVFTPEYLASGFIRKMESVEEIMKQEKECLIRMNRIYKIALYFYTKEQEILERVVQHVDKNQT